MNKRKHEERGHDYWQIFRQLCEAKLLSYEPVDSACHGRVLVCAFRRGMGRRPVEDALCEKPDSY